MTSPSWQKPQVVAIYRPALEPWKNKMIKVRRRDRARRVQWREKERERERNRERQREKQRETETKTERDKRTDRYRDKQRETERSKLRLTRDCKMEQWGLSSGVGVL